MKAKQVEQANAILEKDLRFYEGQNNIKTITFANGDCITVKENEEIKVIMEYGQMAAVPWFGYFKKDILISKWNAAKCEGVYFNQEESK
jgi:hypothetical protein